MSTVTQTFILDNGGYSMKAGWAEDPSPKIIPNCIAKVKSERRRPFIGDQLEECKDYSGLFYILPYTRGYLTNWETQRTVWNHVFKNNYPLQEAPDDRRLLLTEPYFNFRSIQENLLEIFLEEYGFSSMALVNPSSLAAFTHRKITSPGSKCCLVVDAGYSFTHIIPYINGKQVKSGIRRIDVGGKALTNHLKDMISYRQLHVLDETFVMNQCKEDCCYVSLDFIRTLDESKKDSKIARDYVLPDYTHVKRGYVRKLEDRAPVDQQMIRMNNERIQIPEMLFHPSDCGIPQIGISHAIYHSVECQPEEVRPHLYANIVLTGGSSCFPGFRDRIEADIRSLANTFYDVNVILPKDPVCEAWYGGQQLTTSCLDELDKMCIKRKDYEEAGPQLSLEKMESNILR